MKILFKNIILLFIALFFTYVSAQSELDGLYQQGLNAYKNAQFKLAVQSFDHILENDWESPELYYNLGNAYYQSDNISGAVWAFEQCIKLDPLNNDAQFNLQLTNLKVKDRINIPEPPLLLKLFRTLKKMLTPNGWIQLWGVSLILCSIIIAIRKIFNNTNCKHLIINKCIKYANFTYNNIDSGLNLYPDNLYLVILPQKVGLVFL